MEQASNVWSSTGCNQQQNVQVLHESDVYSFKTLIWHFDPLGNWLHVGFVS